LGVRSLTIGVLGVVLGLALSTNADAAGKKLVNYTINKGAIAKSLTGKSGDAAKGRKLAINRKKGNCLACHVMPIPEQAFHGEIGPSLKGVASRLTEGQVRLRIVDPKYFNRDTIMPAFYKNTGFTRVMKKFKGKSMLSAAQIEDLVAYTMTLK
jgi:L-cysteine S-thiosulfotransferase